VNIIPLSPILTSFPPFPYRLNRRGIDDRSDTKRDTDAGLPDSGQGVVEEDDEVHVSRKILLLTVIFTIIL